MPPDLYEKFLERKPSNPVTSREKFSLRFELDTRENAIEKANLLFESIRKPFSYEEFDTYFRENHNTDLPENLYAIRDTMMMNTLFSLIYRILESKNKKFSFLGGVALKAYCSYDEKTL